MGSDIKSLVEKNDLKLPSERVQSLMKTLKERTISHLSEERESGPFLLYCLGDDLNTISAKTGFPIEIIIVTAIHYRWDQKLELYNKVKGADPSVIQKDLANTMLVATYVGYSRELGEVISGKRDVAHCKLLPKDIHGLEKLINLVKTANNLADPQAAGAKTIVNAQNVQINQQPAQIEENKAKENLINVDKVKVLRDL